MSLNDNVVLGRERERERKGEKKNVEANLISGGDTVRFGVALHRERGQLLFPIQQQQDPRPDNV